MSDVDGDGALNQQEFCVAMHLVYNRLSGRELPKKVPEELVVSLQPVRVPSVPVRACTHCTVIQRPQQRGPGTGRSDPNQGYREPERGLRPVFVPEQQRVLQAFATTSAGDEDGAAGRAQPDLFAVAPTASQLHHATRDRPTIRYGAAPGASIRHHGRVLRRRAPSWRRTEPATHRTGDAERHGGHRHTSGRRLP